MKFQIFDTNSQMGVIEYLQKLDTQKRYNIEILLKREKRTIPQNRLYWLYLACIEDETGMDKEDLHDHFKRKYLRKEDIVLGNDTIEQKTSTKKLDTKQFTDYINKIVVFASSELGIVLPDPADRLWEQFYERYKDAA